MITLISCMNNSYYQKIGRLFLQSVQSYLDDDPRLELVVFCEDFKPSERHPRLRYLSTTLFRSKYHQLIKKYTLRQPTESKAKRHKKYLLRFIHKVYSVVYSLEHLSSSDYIVWLDSDIILHSTLSYNWISSILKGDYFSWYLSTGQAWGMETGFMAFNNRHGLKTRFLELYRSYYEQPGKYLEVPKFKDAFVFDRVIDSLPLQHRCNLGRLDIPVKDLFQKSVLKETMTHYIGYKKNNKVKKT